MFGEQRTGHGAESVGDMLVLTNAHAAQGGIKRVVRQWLARITDAREDKHAMPGYYALRIEDLQCLA